MTVSKKQVGEPELFPDPQQGRDWDDLALVYAKSARTLKRYDQLGREVGDPCPLETPSLMPAWWQKHMKQQIPKVILDAARAKTPPPPAAPSPKPEETPTDPDEEAEVTEQEMGLEKTLERLSKMEVRLSRKANEPGQTKAWLDTISRMSSVAEKLRIEAVRLGKLLPRDQVEEALHTFHGPIEREIRLLYRTMSDVLGLQPSPEKEAKWNAEVDSIFRRFHKEVLR